MMGRTHIAFGLWVGIETAKIMHEPITASLIVPLIIGATISDIDNPNTKIGRWIPKALFGNRGKHPSQHRSWPHSIWMLSGFVLNVWLGLGILTHLFLDMLNPSRIPLFYPSGKKVGLKLIRSGGIGDMALFLAFVVMLVVQNDVLSALSELVVR